MGEINYVSQRNDDHFLQMYIEEVVEIDLLDNRCVY